MQKKNIYIFLSLIIVYCIGFGIDMMDIDASQYAEISREMNLSGSYLQVFELGKDYLDKPPFLFWISALSMKLFGANNIAYRLPSFMFALFALYSTYKFSLLYYRKEIASLAVLVLATSQAFFLMNHDVRTDTILMSWVIFSIWQLAAWFKNGCIKNIILASIGIGFGMLTKGPIALIVPTLAIGSHLIVSRKLGSIFKWQHLLAFVIIAIVLLPMSIGLYEQFDMQPQKIVNEKKATSGLRFFYWTQSFGRITGESSWNNNANIFFLFQNMLWAFLPWVLVFLAGLFFEIKSIIKQKCRIESNDEFICTGGFLLSYLALGSSKYQLPHYIFLALPLAAIITAKYLYIIFEEKKYKRLAIFFEKSHFVILLLLWIALLVLLFYCFPAALFIKIIASICFLGFLYVRLSSNVKHYFLIICIFSIISINLFLNSSIYPSLLRYQTGNSIGKFIKEKNIDPAKCFIYQDHIWHSLQFYVNKIITHKDDVSTVNTGDYIILPKEKLADFTNHNINFTSIFNTETFPITKLNLRFLNPATRLEETTTYYLIKIE